MPQVVINFYKSVREQLIESGDSIVKYDAKGIKAEVAHSGKLCLETKLYLSEAGVPCKILNTHKHYTIIEIKD